MLFMEIEGRKTTLKNYAKHEVLEDNQVIVIDVPNI